MNDKLALSELFFGKTDAHNELYKSGKKHYKNSFLQYEKYKIDDFIKGEKFYICGNKGTGKTALLKYLECFLSDNNKNFIIPIRFKSDFDDEDKKSMKRISANLHEEIIEELNTQNSNEYVSVWLVYLLNKIFYSLDCENLIIFDDKDKEYQTIKKLLKCLYEDATSKLMPKLKKGLAKVDLSIFSGIDLSIATEIEFDEKSKQINYIKTTKVILRLFERLFCLKNLDVYVTFDELELSVRSKKENARDIELVRDLILAVEKLNKICKNREYTIKIIASIRSEVVSSVYSAGYEINKPIEDFGVTISWYQKGGNYRENPLLKIIESKIKASEIESGITNHGNVWEKYFDSKINNLDVRKYILNYSWYRPRDVIRMLNLVQEHARTYPKFTQEMFDRALQEYSEKSWNEILEELKLKYSSEDLKAINKIFTNIEVPFTLGSLNDHIEKLGKVYDYVENFNNSYKTIDLLEVLFEWGVIGNTGQRMIFKFLGYRDLAPTHKMIIHKPLRNYFAVQSNPVDNEFIDDDSE